MTTRRSLLGAALAAPLAATARAQGDALTFMTPFGFIPDFIEMMNMVSGGHLARQGFQPTLLGGQGTATAIQQLLAGRVEFIRATAIDQFVAVANHGAPMLAVATLYQGGTFQVISLKEKPIRDVADLRGKTVGVVSVGGSTEQLLDIMLRSGGIPAEAVRREVTGNNPGAVQFIRQGRVDAFIASIGVAVRLRRAGEPVEIWSTDRYAPMPGQIYITTREKAEREPERIVRFLRALKVSAEEVMGADLAGVFQRAARDFEIPGIRDLDGLVALVQTAVNEMWLAQGRENLLRNVPALWEKADRGIRDAGIAAVPDVSALYTNRFIERALAG